MSSRLNCFPGFWHQPLKPRTFERKQAASKTQWDLFLHPGFKERILKIKHRSLESFTNLFFKYLWEIFVLCRSTLVHRTHTRRFSALRISLGEDGISNRYSLGVAFGKVFSNKNITAWVFGIELLNNVKQWNIKLVFSTSLES